MLKPVARRSLATEVFEQLRDHILDGELEPGAALPAERVLAEQLEVNRSAVREGLKRLEQAGLVSIQQGGATRVLDFKRTAGLELLAAMVVRGDGTIDTAVARGVLELRTQLAPIVARLCTQRADASTHAALGEVVAEMEASRGDLPTLQRLALDFWAVVVDGTGNVALELAFNSLAGTYDGVLEQFTQVLATEIGAVHEYAALAEAVVGGQPKRAATIATRIVSRGAEAIETVLQAVDSVQRDGGGNE
ncbi:MAG TPA: GntR family transcriptional regulator [Sandaracinaceae bacterium LLY-WYZ-13_1]|nr:GntR family transcriptional regulator [Sandaracinaceae bacterium LLY-WYZ-13_1]